MNLIDRAENSAPLSAAHHDRNLSLLEAATANSRAAVETMQINAAAEYVRTAGYAEPGDGGGALYKRAAFEPSHAGKVLSLDGAWWEVVGPVNVGQFSSIGDALSASAVLGCTLTIDEDATLPAGDVAAFLSALPRIVVRGSVTITLPSGVTAVGEIDASPTGGSGLRVVGATPVSYTITAHTPTVAATTVSGNRSHYDVTFTLADASGLSVGDWVEVRTTGPALSYTNYDLTRAGVRHNELDGAGEVIAVAGSSVTIRNRSRQSADKFPSGTAITLTGGTIRKLPTVLSFSGTAGIAVGADAGEWRNLALVSDDTGGGFAAGVLVDSLTAGTSLHRRSIGLYDCIIARFAGNGINVSGANATATGSGVAVAGCGSHGVRVNGAVASFPNCIASGCGDTAGNGFAAFNAASLYCSNSIANGCRNTGFYSNRGSMVSAENCRSVGHGNYADEIAGAWADSEGKGFEAESAAKMFCNNGIAIYNTELAFYSNSGSSMCAYRCIGSQSLHRHGFYALLGGIISARQSVAQNNPIYGFYAYANSMIEAADTRASGNGTNDYAAQGIGTIWVYGALGSPTYRNTLNGAGLNRIANTNVYDI